MLTKHAKMMYPNKRIRPVQIGDRYQWLRDVGTRSGYVMPKGTVIEVVARTNNTPYGEVGPAGHNWWCASANGYTIWATLEMVIGSGLVALIGKQND
jgi:hypothetical protein